MRAAQKRKQNSREVVRFMAMLHSVIAEVSAEMREQFEDVEMGLLQPLDFSDQFQTFENMGEF